MDQFDKDYAAHIDLLHEKAGIPRDVVPYTITKFFLHQRGQPFSTKCFLCLSILLKSCKLLWPSAEAMGIVAADAIRVSTGGAPAFLVGNQHTGDCI
ncbi:MAG: EthD family reductase [Spirosomataceae bacterium]